MRTGSAASGGKTSRMPPRRLNSPATSTTSTRVIPRSTSQAVSSSTATDVADADRPRRPRPATSGVGTGCSSAWNGATTNRGGDRPGEPLDAPGAGGRRPRRPAPASRGQAVPGGEDLGRRRRRRWPRRRGSRRRRRRGPGRSRASAGACRPSAAAASGPAEPQAPSIVRAPAVLERGEDLGEPRRALDQPGQVLQLADRGGVRRRSVGHA